MRNFALFSLLGFLSVLGFRYLSPDDKPTVIEVKENQWTKKKISNSKMKSKVISKPKIKFVKSIDIPTKNPNTTKVPSGVARLKALYNKKQGYKRDNENLDPNGNILVKNVLFDGEYIIAHGDIIVGTADDVEPFQNGTKIPMILKPKLWPKGVMPYKIEEGLENKENIEEALSIISKKTGLKFPQRKSENNYVHFKKGKQHCYSQVGMQGGEQPIALHPGCKVSHIVHEIVHALGLLHEQNRPDRDVYLSVIWENIDQIHWNQFKKIGTHFVDMSNFEFDFESVMLYLPSAFSNQPGDYSMTTISGDVWENSSKSLSKMDVKKLKYLYP